MNNEVLQHTHQREFQQHDRVSSLIWALVLIWAGAVFFAENFGLLDRVALYSRGGLADLFHLGAWSLILTGAAVLILLGVIIRLFTPDYRGSLSGQLILAAVLFGIGVSDLIGWQVLWPLIIIAVGLSVLVGTVLKRG